jgi:hypothetical protein
LHNGAPAIEQDFFLLLGKSGGVGGDYTIQIGEQLVDSCSPIWMV